MPFRPTRPEPTAELPSNVRVLREHQAVAADPWMTNLNAGNAPLRTRLWIVASYVHLIVREVLTATQAADALQDQGLTAEDHELADAAACLIEVRRVSNDPEHIRYHRPDLDWSDLDAVIVARQDVVTSLVQDAGVLIASAAAPLGLRGIAQ